MNQVIAAMNDHLRNSELYADGFTDGQTDILDEIIAIVDDAEGRTEAYEAIMKFVNEKKREIESL